jgi:hypothetical protein
VPLFGVFTDLNIINYFHYIQLIEPFEKTFDRLKFQTYSTTKIQLYEKNQITHWDMAPKIKGEPPTQGTFAIHILAFSLCFRQREILASVHGDL